MRKAGSPAAVRVTGVAVAASLLVLGTAASALAQVTPLPSPPGRPQDPPPPLLVTSRETVQAELDASGSQVDTRVYTQLTVRGSGQYRIVDPTSTEGLRDLSGFGAPETHAGAAVWNIRVDGSTQRRTVAEFTKTLPIDVRVRYQLDGRPVAPENLVGQSGLLRVTYDVRNVTARPTRLRFQDGTGRVVEETVDVATPYVGQLATTVPSAFGQVSAPRGDVAADGRGGNRVTWSLVLFEPFGPVHQQLTYTARVSDVEIPPARAEFAPVPPHRQPEFRFGYEGYAEGVASGRNLSDGAQRLHEDVLRLRGQASTVLTGVSRLRTRATGLGTQLRRLGQQVNGLSGQLDFALTPNAQGLAARALQVEAEARALSLVVAGRYADQAQRVAGAAHRLALDARNVADTAGQAGSSAAAVGRELATATGGSASLATGLRRAGANQRRLLAGASSISAQGVSGLVGSSRAVIRASARNLAVLQELNRRAAAAGQPYGPPASSVSDSAAYVYTIAGATHDPVDNQRRALVGAGLLLVGSLVATLVRHRVVPWPWSRREREPTQ